MATIASVEIPDNHVSVAEMKHSCTEPISNSVPTLCGLEMFNGSIPLIDMEGLDEVEGPKRAQIIKQIGHACQYHGFFLVKNHGIPESKIKNMLDTARDFFNLPEQERFKFYSTELTKTIRLNTGIKDPSHKLYVTRETFRFSCHPVEDYVNDWPSTPPSFRKNATEYIASIKKMEFSLLEAISESLGLEKDYIYKKYLGNRHRQMIGMIYYPACSEEELESASGLRPHTDPTIITTLIQNNVNGLQALSYGNWVEVIPIPNTFIVQVGDLLQVISNYRYKSSIHKAMMNCKKDRISIASIWPPSPDTVLRPAEELIDPHHHPAIYRDFTYAELYAEIARLGVECPDDKRLDLFKFSSTA